MNRLHNLYGQLVPVLCHSHSNDISKVVTPWQECKRAENWFLEKYPQSTSHTSSENREVWLSHHFLMKSCAGFLICYYHLSKFRMYEKIPNKYQSKYMK